MFLKRPVFSLPLYQLQVSQYCQYGRKYEQCSNHGKCKSEGYQSTENPPVDPEGTLLSYSGCKYGAGKTAADSLTSDTDFLVYSYADGSLLLDHLNTAFNCCPDSLGASIEIIGDTIRIHEEEYLTDGGCRCLCLYDLAYEIQDLASGTYRIELDQMYLPDGEDPLTLNIDLTASP